MSIVSDIQKLNPGALVELFEVDATELGGDRLFFHAMTQVGSVWWRGNEYHPWPVQTEGFARDSDRPPTPALRVANLEGSISVLCDMYEDLAGARVIRRRTFAKYLDARNFPGPELASAAPWRTQTTANPHVLLADGRTEVTYGGTASFRLFRDMTLVPGKTYYFSVDVDNKTSSSVRLTTFRQTGSTVGQVWLGTTIAPGVRRVESGFFVAPENAEAVGAQGTGVAVGETFILGDVSVYEVGNPSADPDQELPPESWFIERKVAETPESVEFELASVLDFNGVQLPRRQIVANMCPWAYRSADCGYIGPPVADLRDNPTSDPSQDICGKRYASCKLRFPGDVELPFGGFPAASLMRM